MNIFTSTIKVSEKHIDERNHVNNLVYLQWCLDVAEAHWKKYASTTIMENYVWYVVNHTIDYKASAFVGEQLQVTTWVATANGVRSERHYKIVRLSDNKVIVEAKTTWCLLDNNSLKPTKITEEIKRLFFK